MVLFQKPVFQDELRVHLNSNLLRYEQIQIAEASQGCYPGDYVYARNNQIIP